MQTNPAVEKRIQITAMQQQKMYPWYRHMSMRNVTTAQTCKRDIMKHDKLMDFIPGSGCHTFL